MEQLNRYYLCSKLSERKFRQLVRCFALDLTAGKTTGFTGLTRKSVTTIFLRIRERIAEACERASPFSACEVEVDESYFGARRVALAPSPDRCMIRGEVTLSHPLFEVTVREPVSAILTDAQQDDGGLEVAPLKRGLMRLQEYDSCRVMDEPDENSGSEAILATEP